MTWITENAEHLAALVGAVYVVARIVVAMTPTKKDDEVVAKLAKWLGLDAKQGRTAPSEPQE